MDPPRSRDARDHATARVPTARPDQLVKEIRTALTDSVFDCADDVAVVSDGVLRGILPIERLRSASEGDRVADVMDGDPPVVTPDANLERVAWEMVRRGE